MKLCPIRNSAPQLFAQFKVKQTMHFLRVMSNAGIALWLTLLFASGCASVKKPKTIYDVQVASFKQTDEATALGLTFGVLHKHGIMAVGSGNAGGASVCVPPNQAAEARIILLEEQAGLAQKERATFQVVWTCDDRKRWPELDFLKDLPALRNISMNMSEERFLKILRDQKLYFEGTISPYRPGQSDSTEIISFYRVIPKDHVVVFVSFRNGRCSTVSRMQ